MKFAKYLAKTYFEELLSTNASAYPTYQTSSSTVSFLLVFDQEQFKQISFLRVTLKTLKIYNKFKFYC